MPIFFTFSSPSSHLHPLQVENCDSNSRLVVNEDDNVKFGLKGLNKTYFFGSNKLINLQKPLVDVLKQLIVKKNRKHATIPH